MSERKFEDEILDRYLRENGDLEVSKKDALDFANFALTRLDCSDPIDLHKFEEWKKAKLHSDNDNWMPMRRLITQEAENGLRTEDNNLLPWVWACLNLASSLPVTGKERV